MTLVHVQREFDKFSIRQRADDGYFSATDICQAAGKDWFDYYRLDSTQIELNLLSDSLELPIRQRNSSQLETATALVQVFHGGNQEQGTWVHPAVAVSLARWCSVKMRIAVNRYASMWLSSEHLQIVQPEAAEGDQLPERLAEFFEEAAEQQTRIEQDLDALLDVLQILERLRCVDFPERERLTFVRQFIGQVKDSSWKMRYLIHERLGRHILDRKGGSDDA